MILARYLQHNYLRYFFTLNSALVLLYFCIELCEKLMRKDTCSTATIFITTATQLIPNFFARIPLSSWLATCLILKTLDQTHAPMNLASIGIPPERIMRSIYILGIGIGFFYCIGTESTIAYYQRIVIQQRQSQTTRQKTPTWHALTPRMFITYKSYNPINNELHDLHIVRLNTRGQLHQHLAHAHGRLDPAAGMLHITRAVYYNDTQHRWGQITDRCYHAPQICHLLSTDHQATTLWQVWHHTNRRNRHSIRQRCYDYALPAVYIILPFFIMMQYAYHRWASALVTILLYPLCTLLGIIADRITDPFWHRSILLIPFVFLLCMIIYEYKKLVRCKKQRASYSVQP